MTPRCLWLSAAIGLGLLTASTAVAGEYVVEFDCFDRNPATDCRHQFGVRMTIDDSYFAGEFTGWGSYGHPNGSRVLNGSGKTLVAVHIKVKDPSDKFRHDPSSPDRLFREVWRKKDGSEMIFNGANLPDNSYFWSRVLPRTPGFPTPFFLGRASDRDIPVPQDGNWERVSPAVERKQSKLWTSLISATPNHYRKVQAYAESGDGTKVLLVSEDDILLYDHRTKMLRHVVLPHATPAGINRVTVEKGEKGETFVLWLNGGQVGRVNLTRLKLGSAVGRAGK